MAFKVVRTFGRIIVLGVLRLLSGAGELLPALLLMMLSLHLTSDASTHHNAIRRF
jgi:predicted RND superfamily exporter protein